MALELDQDKANTVRQPEGGTWAGVSRDLNVLGTAAVHGLGNGVNEAASHPWQFAGDLLAPAGLMLAARGPAYVKVPAMIAGLIGTGVFGAQVVSGVKNSLPALSDAYYSGQNLNQDQTVVDRELGPIAFNTAVMAGVGIGASKVGTMLYGRMEFPLVGVEEPGRLPTGELARAVDRAQPAMVRIAGEQTLNGVSSKFQGSGYIFHPDGYALTSLHNVDPAIINRFDVIVDGESRGWKLVGTDPLNDAAVIQITKNSPAERFPFLKHSSSDLKAAGTRAVGLGYKGHTDVLEAAPARLTGALHFDDQVKDWNFVDNRRIPQGATRNVYNLGFDHGQSGGPLLNAKGRVAGLLTNVMTDTNTGKPLGGLATRITDLNAFIKRLGLS
jgi:S1-C subfamily serine protease